MTDDEKKELTDTTLGGLKIPVPTCKAFFDNLEKVSRPQPPDDEKADESED